MRSSDIVLFGSPLLLLAFGGLARWYSAWSTRRFREQQQRLGAAE